MNMNIKTKFNNAKSYVANSTSDFFANNKYGQKIATGAAAAKKSTINGFNTAKKSVQNTADTFFDDNGLGAKILLVGSKAAKYAGVVAGIEYLRMFIEQSDITAGQLVAAEAFAAMLFFGGRKVASILQKEINDANAAKQTQVLAKQNQTSR